MKKGMGRIYLLRQKVRGGGDIFSLLYKKVRGGGWQNLQNQ